MTSHLHQSMVNEVLTLDWGFRMSENPDAFLSYTRVDDDFFGGAITSLRKLLELGVQVVTGNRDFYIFQDVDGIQFGENWQKTLDQQLLKLDFLFR